MGHLSQLVTYVLMLVSLGAAVACECAKTTVSDCNGGAASMYVTVLTSSEGDGPCSELKDVYYVIRVHEVFKNEIPSLKLRRGTVITMSSTRDACEASLKPGGKYVVFANPTDALSKALAELHGGATTSRRGIRSALRVVADGPYLTIRERPKLPANIKADPLKSSESCADDSTGCDSGKTPRDDKASSGTSDLGTGKATKASLEKCDRVPILKTSLCNGVIENPSRSAIDDMLITCTNG
jgi:hypothetical protein